MHQGDLLIDKGGVMAKLGYDGGKVAAELRPWQAAEALHRQLVLCILRWTLLLNFGAFFWLYTLLDLSIFSHMAIYIYIYI